MSREFWNTLGWVLLIFAIVVPIVGWYLDVEGVVLFSVFVCSFLGAVYMAQLGNASKSRKDRTSNP